MIWEILDAPHWLLVYDIAHPKRLRKVAAIAANAGIRLQRSVYILTLAQREVQMLCDDLEAAIHPQKDDVRLYHLPAGTRIAQQQRARRNEGILIASAGVAWSASVAAVHSQQQ